MMALYGSSSGIFWAAVLSAFRALSREQVAMNETKASITLSCNPFLFSFEGNGFIPLTVPV